MEEERTNDELPKDESPSQEKTAKGSGNEALMNAKMQTMSESLKSLHHKGEGRKPLQRAESAKKRKSPSTEDDLLDSEPEAVGCRRPSASKTVKSHSPRRRQRGGLHRGAR